MKRFRCYSYTPNRFIELRDPDPEPADPTDGEEAPSPTVIKAHEIEGLPSLVGNQVKKVLGGMGVVTKTDMDGIVDRISAAMAPAPSDPAPAPSDPDPAPSGDDSQHQTPVDTQLRRMQSELADERRSRQKLEQSLQDEKQSASIEKRDNHIRQVAHKLGADDANDVLTLVRDDLIEDSERGWVFEHDGEFGKEFSAPEEYLNNFLDKKPHLKKARPRGGSGAGAGDEFPVPASGTIDGRNLDADAMRDADWYRENRKKIHKDLDKKMTSYRANRGAIDPK